MKTCAYKPCSGKFHGSNRQKVCGPTCALAMAKTKRFEAQQQIQRRKDRDWKKANRRVTEHFADAKRAFCEYRRLVDAQLDLPCPTCGRSADEIQNAHGSKPGSPWNAGHWKSATKHPATAFAEENCVRQCASCNSGSHYHTRKAKLVDDKFRDALIRRFGLRKIQEVERLAEIEVRWTKKKLDDIRDHYRNKTKLLLEMAGNH